MKSIRSRVSAYDLSQNGGLQKLRDKLIKQMKEKETNNPTSPYQPKRIPAYAYL